MTSNGVLNNLIQLSLRRQYRVFNIWIEPLANPDNINKIRLIIVLSVVVLILMILNLLFGRNGERQRSEAFETQALRDLSELATVEYKINKIIRVKDDSILGSRRLLIEVPATVKAGIDLSKITTRDIVRTDKTITVYLPEPELLDLIVDLTNVREVVNETGVFRSDFSPGEKNTYLRNGEKAVREYVKNGKIDILNVSVVNARLILGAWLRRLGYENVEIVFQQPGIRGRDEAMKSAGGK